MINENKVSLWLGKFENAEAFNTYINIGYDEDGNTIPSNFQIDFGIEKYDLEAVESDWMSDPCEDIDTLLTGFSNDFEIIPEIKPFLENIDLKEYNSILLLYKFDYSQVNQEGKEMRFIGTVDVNL